MQVRHMRQRGLQGGEKETRKEDRGKTEREE